MSHIEISPKLIIGLSALLLSSCATGRARSAYVADLNGDGRVSPSENTQYTRQLTVQQNHEIKSFRKNVADVDHDGLISDTEWDQYRERQAALQANAPQGAKGRDALGTTHTVLSIANLTRWLF